MGEKSAVRKKDPAAVALGRKGGKNSRANLTPEESKALAQKAAAARWKDKPILLANALRETGRNFQDGKPIDIAVVRDLVEAMRAERPHMCARLTDLLQEAEAEIARGDRDAAMKHFRSAIAEAERKSDQSPAPKGE